MGAIPIVTSVLVAGGRPPFLAVCLRTRCSRVHGTDRNRGRRLRGFRAGEPVHRFATIELKVYPMVHRQKARGTRTGQRAWDASSKRVDRSFDLPASYTPFDRPNGNDLPWVITTDNGKRLSTR